MEILKMASIYKVGLFVLSIYLLSFLVVTMGDFFTFIKKQILNGQSRRPGDDSADVATA